MVKRAIYWFKRDLRVNDNRAFLEATKKSNELIPIFIFIPELLEKFKSYDRRLGFIVESIKNLSREIEKLKGRLFCFYGEPKEVFEYLIERYKPESIFTNRAFSWSGERIEERINNLCRDKNIKFYSLADNFLCELDKIPFRRIYTHFFTHWKKNLNLSILPPPDRINTPKLNEPDINEITKHLIFRKNLTWSVSFGFDRMEKFDFLNYEQTRNRLDMDGTSKLSPYIRFGLISLRNLYKNALEKGGEDCQFIKELAWREFWYHIKINLPGFNQLEFQEKRRDMRWSQDETLISAFINAKTGYPIVDASIIQLKEEGWMHNRARMIVANFLTKDLFIDWRVGERFFMEYLLDYDEVVNTGNWQWNASVGPDPKPLRIFNPILQAKKFDPEAFFIKKYLPELKNMPPLALHDPISYKLNYYKPIVNHYDRVMYIKRQYFKINNT